MSGQLTDAEQVLDSLDEAGGRDPMVASRRAVRRRWRKRLKVKLTQPGGDQRTVEIVTRNLSRGGLSFLNNGFLHVGTRCELVLMTADNALVDIHATVVRCRYVTGRVHEISLRFDEPADDGLFVARELSASILLVDDAEDLLRLTAHFLSKAGAEVANANHGVRALKLAAEHEFDLVLLDVEMPGIDGPAVAKTLRERGIAIPIIAYTAHDDQVTRERCLAAGCSDVLAKPLGKTELIETMAQYLAVESPIISTLAGDPEMTEFIHDFAANLPAKIQEIQRCVQARNAEESVSLARQLKIAASDDGGCGFGEVSAAADALAKTLTGIVEWAAVEAAMDALGNLSHRVQAPNE